MPSDDHIRDLRPPPPRGSYDPALRALAASTRTRIAHIDCGVAPHPALGYGGPAGDEPPDNLLVDEGANLFDPEMQPEPVSPLRRSSEPLASLIEYPDHGVKTLSAILGATEHLVGVGRGVRVVPYRVSNGPLFRDGTGPLMQDRDAAAALGAAIEAALNLSPPARVLSISMGNPGWLGPFDFLVRLLGGTYGLPRRTARMIDRAYEEGVVIVCAAGQVIDRVVYPAAYARTIAVGGFDRRGGLHRHYPASGYGRPELVDIWAQAMRINRASFLLEAQPPAPIHADDPRNTEDEPSGTSYAAPQVATAAALWVERHFDRLEEMFATERWKIPESFRSALRESADRVEAGLADGGSVPIRALNIPRLLDRAPQGVPSAPARRAVGQGLF